MTAHGALIALHQLGVDVGGELKIVSQSNAGSPVLEREAEEITRLEYNPQHVVALMVEHLEALLASERRSPGTQYVTAIRRDSSRFQLAKAPEFS